MNDLLQKLSDDISALTIMAIVNEWKAQGHNLTGKAINEIETVVKFNINELTITGLVLDYMAINNRGVPANKIPYYPGSGRKESEYIKGLMKYVQQRMGKSEKESKSIAFAIASKHKKEGMPTRASARFSSTGKRTGFIETALNKIEPELKNLIEKSIIYSIELTITTFYKSILNR